VSGLVPTDSRVSVAGFDPGTAGVTPPSDPARRGVFLTDVVAELGFADREKIDEAARAVGRSGKSVEQYLLDSGILDESRLSLAIAERNGLDHVDLDRFEVDAGAADMVGRSAAQRYRAVPIAFASDGALIVAVEDPFDSLGVSDIEVMAKCEVRTVIAAPSGIRRLIEKLPDEPARPAPAEPRPEPEQEPALQPEPAPRPEAEQGPAPQPQPEPDPEPLHAARVEGQPERLPSSPEPEPAAGGELGDLSTELRALQETARKADALAVTVERRIEELEGVDERVRQLERELLAAREDNADLEQRLSGVDRAAAELRATTEKLGATCRALEESAG
jgi:MshEN domain